MSNEDRTLKILIETSIIVFSLSLILFGICFPSFILGGENYIGVVTSIFVASQFLMGFSAIAILVATIIMIVKICCDPNIKTGDKVLWGILVYLLNAFVLPFAFNIFILKTDDNKGAIKLVIFEGISIIIMIFSFIIFSFQIFSLLAF